MLICYAFYVYNHKQKVKNKSKLTRNKKVFFATFLIVLIGVASFVVIQRNNSKKQDISTNPEDQTIKYLPATPEEKEAAENKKNEIVKKQEEQNQPALPPGTKKTVTPTITNTTGSINAYVSGIFEEGGTCTAEFTKDSVILTKASEGFQNVSYTQCAPMNLEQGFLSPGRWNLVVKYSSEKSEGISEKQIIEIN